MAILSHPTTFPRRLGHARFTQLAFPARKTLTAESKYDGRANAQTSREKKMR
jgi:hypothetical protein